tara:strand:+ start:716 stop:2116 length:1401 start_codon:yes stop_codon:yes gene_type:complete
MSGRYRTVREIASGGMGRVLLCVREEGRFKRLYAVKRLHPHLQQDTDFRAMFQDEARVAGLVRHPNVVSVIDVDEDEQGTLLVMEYIDGIPLTKLMKLNSDDGGQLPIEVCLRIALDIAEGLHAAHEARDHDGRPLNLVHRDLSPHNVLLEWSGRARITDFGIAKAAGQSTSTATGVLKGKLAYLAPEQVQFLPVDRRTDIFALGIVLYEMLTGKRLFRSHGDQHSGIHRILHDPAPDVGEERLEVPPAIVELLFRMLDRDPAERPTTAAEVAATLRRTLLAMDPQGDIQVSDTLEALASELRSANEAATRSELSRALQTPTPVRDRRYAVGIAVGVALVALALVATAGWSLGRHEARPAEAAPADEQTALAAPLVAEPARRPAAVPIPIEAPEEAVMDAAVAGAPGAERVVGTVDAPRSATKRRRRTPRRGGPPGTDDAVMAAVPSEAAAMQSEAAAMQTGWVEW